jgi:hypothetical protein
VALAFLPPELTDGERLQVDARGSLLDATVVRPPFVKRS